MPDPCRQEPRINHIEGELTAMVKELREGQKEQTGHLRDIARQSERIRNLEHTTARHEKAIEALYERSREADKLPGAMAIRVLLTLSTLGSAVVSGVAVFALTH